MNTHETYADLLPFYAAGHLDGEQRRAVELHLQECTACQADLALWQAVGAEIAATERNLIAPHIETRKVFSSNKRSPAQKDPGQGDALKQRIKPLGPTLKRAWQLLWAQIPLVQREMWPAAALVMAIGFLVILLVDKIAVLRVLAPLVTAASMAVIYGPEHDPAAEITASTPTSPWKILLARVTLVFGYNLLLALVISVLIITFTPIEGLGVLVLGWLAPMAFLSALALMLSLWVGTTNALMVAYLGWLAQFIIPFTAQPFAGIVDWAVQLMAYYAKLWQSPVLLFSLAGLLLLGALWSAERSERSFRIQTG